MALVIILILLEFQFTSASKYYKYNFLLKKHWVFLMFIYIFLKLIPKLKILFY